jgi:hypothetical protein
MYTMTQTIIREDLCKEAATASFIGSAIPQVNGGYSIV